MLRNTRSYPLILVLAVSLTFVLGWGSKAEGSKLTDLGEASWAEKAITEMEASGVVTGYPGDVYKPYNDVTKLESVAMLIRMLGLKDQAEAAEKTGADYVLPPDIYWGSGYLFMAVARGMLDGDYLHLLQPNVPATRTEVAMLAFHALALDPDSSEMEFSDADQIPADYREGVAAVVKSGIMQGLPGNVFKPNDNINRAQIAVMMSKIVELKYADPCPARRAGGTVTNIEPNSRVITLDSVGSIFYADGCEFFLDGTSVLPEELKSGDHVEIIMDKNQHAVYANALRPTDARKYKGSVSLILSSGGEYWLSIIGNDGQELTRPVVHNVEVYYSGEMLSVTDLNKGDYVEILVSNYKIIKIVFLGTSTSLEGEIKDLDDVGTMGITIRDDEGDTTEYEVADDVVVKRDGLSIDFDDLNEGDRVRLELDSSDRIDYVEVLKMDQLEGEIRDLDTIGTMGIVIRNDDGKTTEYVVIDDVKVERDGDRIDFDDLDEGDWVRLELNSRDQVCYIEANEEYSNAEGTVDDLAKDGRKLIRIRRSSGNRVQYDIADGADFYRYGDRISLDDIVIGSYVEVLLDDDEVIKIEVINDRNITLEGSVIYVNERDKKLRVEQVSGNRFTYGLADDPDLKNHGGYSIDLDDIEEDWEVRINLEDGEITTLTVLK
ncbi:S-layer homology domain-containing protein [Pelotomaculum propionicicum]|uniref:S-layer homology domain-containing protein n=1 Tax=Pelotomaculum propionicicum TaxID=258475 RepID=UPI003B7D6204